MTPGAASARPPRGGPAGAAGTAPWWAALLTVACAAEPGRRDGDGAEEDPLAGARWQVQVPGPAVSLRGLSVLPGGVVWASGAAGTVLRTVDGGRTWQPFGGGALGDGGFHAVASAADGTVWAVGRGGRVARLARAAQGLPVPSAGRTDTTAGRP